MTISDAHPSRSLAACSNPPSGVLGMLDIARRVSWVRGFRSLIATHERELCNAVELDVHKDRWQALTQELMPLVASARWHERHARRILAPRRVPGGPWWALGQRHQVLRRPVGRVLIIATWNYPVQLLGIQLIQAVMAGNSVVVKPSERAPRSQRLLVELARRALSDIGETPGLVASTEATREAGKDVLQAERFDHVIFTGSTEVGRQVAEVCARTLTPTTLELSGSDSAIVTAGAPLELAARSVWAAVTMNAGQTCMAPRRVLVEEECLDEFLAHLRPLAAAARPVRLASGTMSRQCADLVKDAVQQGGQPLSGVVENADGDWLRPQGVLDCPRSSKLVEGQHFGPVVAVLAVRDMADALAVHRAAGQHLATSLYTGSPGEALRDPRVIDQLASGVVTINDTVVPTGHPGVSIAGRGRSGWGATRGTEGLLALTYGVHVMSTSRWLRPPTAEPTPFVQRMLQRFAIGRPSRGSAGAATGVGVADVAGVAGAAGVGLAQEGRQA